MVSARKCRRLPDGNDCAVTLFERTLRHAARQRRSPPCATVARLHAATPEGVILLAANVFDRPQDGVSPTCPGWG